MKPLVDALMIGCGGALGALLRYAIHESTLKLTSKFPLGTLISNTIGCFLIGVLIGSGRSEKNPVLKLAFGVGFLGALTTFSTFGGETVTQAQSGNWSIATANVAANIGFGLVAVVLGIVAGRKFFA